MDDNKLDMILGALAAERFSGGIALCGYIGCLVIAAVAARRRVVRFFERMERLMA
ncbi:MAG: hypothetical protein HY770_08585 [Chitinivibrionia bacterium]|nr:hypothetical protein [Chitinivibrionia bacterium]